MKKIYQKPAVKTHPREVLVDRVAVVVHMPGAWKKQIAKKAAGEAKSISAFLRDAVRKAIEA